MYLQKRNSHFVLLTYFFYINIKINVKNAVFLRQDINLFFFVFFLSREIEG